MADMSCKVEAIGGTMGQAETTFNISKLLAAWYNTWLLIKLMPKGVVFTCLFLFTQQKL